MRFGKLKIKGEHARNLSQSDAQTAGKGKKVQKNISLGIMQNAANYGQGSLLNMKN